MKKLITLCIAAAMALSIAACGSGTDPSSSAAESSAPESAAASESSAAGESSEAAESEPDLEESSEKAAAMDLPEIDGYTKSEQQGTTMYTAEDGSVIVVQSTPADAESLAGFEEKDPDLLAEMNEQINAAFGALMPGATVSGDFATVEGKSVYLMSLSVPKDEANGIPQDMNVIVYMLAGDGGIVAVTGTGPDAGLDAKLTGIVKAL